MTEVTIAIPVIGVTDHDIPQPFTVEPGTYPMDDIDDDRMFLVVDDVPDVCVIVTRESLGLVECVACGGRGSYSYRVSADEWESDECGDCLGTGGVTPDVAAEREAQRDRERDDAMRNEMS